MPPLKPNSLTCSTGANCDLCRQFDAGRAWRERLQHKHDLPGGVVDFTCPSGKPWASRGLGDDVANLLNATGIGPLAKRVIEATTGKPCGCSERQQALNELMPRRS